MKRKIALFLVTALTISAVTTGEGQTVLAQDVDGEHLLQRVIRMRLLQFIRQLIWLRTLEERCGKIMY